MLEEDYEVEYSPLCQSLTSEGLTVQVQIYRGDNGGWILEVEDEFLNSTLWEQEFSTDVEALAEAKAAVLEDGIASLIGPAT